MTLDSIAEPFGVADDGKPDDGPADLRDTETSPNRCQKSGCVNPVLRTGKGGRPPKYCPEHKNGSGSPRSSSKSDISGKSWPRATEIETILCNYVSGLGYTVSLVNPADGKVIATGAPKVVHELVELAKTDTKLRKPLEMLCTPGKYGPLTMATLALVIPIMANHGMMPQFQISGLTPSPEGGGD